MQSYDLQMWVIFRIFYYFFKKGIKCVINVEKTMVVGKMNVMEDVQIHSQILFLRLCNVFLNILGLVLIEKLKNKVKKEEKIENKIFSFKKKQYFKFFFNK